jgi:hypothetical protein
MIFMTLISCNNSTKLTEEEKKEIRAEVKGLLIDNFVMIKEMGYTEELQTLDNSPDFYWIPPRKSMPISYDSVAAILKKFTPGYKSVENVWDTLYIQPLTSEVASYTGRFHSTYTDTSGHVSNFKMMEIGVVAKRNGQWKLVSGQTSVQ